MQTDTGTSEDMAGAPEAHSASAEPGEKAIGQDDAEAARRKLMSDLSGEALRGGLAKFAKVGVSLPRKKGFPAYSVSDDDPTVFIRTLDGRTERGRFENGGFVPTE